MTDFFDDLSNENELNGKKASSDTFTSAARDIDREDDMAWVHWGLCEELTVEQAALISAGYLPDEYPYAFNWELHKWPAGLYPVATAIKNAIESGTLPAKKRYMSNEGDFPACMPLDLALTKIKVSDLVDWFRQKGKTPYTFGLLRVPLESKTQSDSAQYLDVNNPYFSIKLKAAIDVWEAVSSNPPKSTSPKEAIKAWLREHANSYELMKDDGTPNETAIEEIAKIVHWRGKGGAIKMPVIHGPEPQF